ncbi:MAG: nitroreductase family protein [Thermoplasmata archaeon]
MEVAEAIRARRARRALRTDAIDQDKVDALVEAARLSASCFNNQPWRLIFVRDPASLAAVKAAMSKGNEWTSRAPMIIAVAAKEEDDCRLSDRRNYFLFDCGLAIGQVELAATELGLIAHPIAGYDPLKVKEVLGIPAEYVLITLVICGYPGGDESLLSDKQKEAERTRPERKPLGENIFLDRWANPYPSRH